MSHSAETSNTDVSFETSNTDVSLFPLYCQSAVFGFVASVMFRAVNDDLESAAALISAPDTWLAAGTGAASGAVAAWFYLSHSVPRILVNAIVAAIAVCLLDSQGSDAIALYGRSVVLGLFCGGTLMDAWRNPTRVESRAATNASPDDGHTPDDSGFDGETDHSTVARPASLLGHIVAVCAAAFVFSGIAACGALAVFAVPAIRQTTIGIAVFVLATCVAAILTVRHVVGSTLATYPDQSWRV